MAPSIPVVLLAGMMVSLASSQAADEMPPPVPSPGAGFHASEEGKQRRGCVEAVVSADSLNVFNTDDRGAYIVCRLERGDRVTIRADQGGREGWFVIAPPPTVVCWIEETALELDNERGTDEFEETFDPRGRQADGPARAWVSKRRAVLRSGNPGARIPGPPRGFLDRGALVQLVDRPPLNLGSGETASRWRAIVPPEGQVFHLEARPDDLRWLSPAAKIAPAAEIRASYEGPARSSPEGGGDGHRIGTRSWPPELAAELERTDAMDRAIVVSQPIEEWRLETVRAGYQSLLKRVGDRPDLEEELRTRLARITRHEQASKAARNIQEILARSRKRDREVAQIEARLVQSERTRSRAYDAVGFVQPSARKVEGHKVFALIGGEGSTIAYLDIPAGLDPHRLLTRRVGIRGQAHFSEDLGARLITVRDIEAIEAKR